MYAVGVTWLGEIMITVKKNVKLFQAHCPVVMSLAWNSVNAEKTENVFQVPWTEFETKLRHRDINNCFENVTEFKYSGMILMKQQRFMQNASVIEGCNFVHVNGMEWN